MLNYLLRRLLYSILLLWGVATLVFLLFNVLPANPARLTLSRQTDPASVNTTRLALRMDQQIGTRYGLYLNDLSPIGVTSARKNTAAPRGIQLTRLTGGNYLSLKAPYLGQSYSTNRAVSGVLGVALPGTIGLALAAMILAVILGISLGVLAAVKKGTIWDTSTIAASVAGISIPAFFAGLLIVYFSGYFLSSKAALGMANSLNDYKGFKAQRLSFASVILPALALAIRPMAIIIQHTRVAMLDALSQAYIRTAYAKGLSATRVVLRHAIPNALVPILTSTPAWLAELLAGSFFIEYIFGWKGIGKITVDALDKFDLPLVTGAVLLIALIFIIVHFLTDVASRMLNPARVGS